jgi:C-terminal processing protease CtpA/Prc
VAVDIASLFRTGDFGAKIRRDGTIETIRTAASPVADGPLVVLIDAGAASAAEFAAAALQGTPKVRLVGSPSRGRGQAQTYVALDDGWGLVIPSAHLRNRQGTDLKDHPLQPDIPVTDSTLKEASNGDLTYQRAISVLARLSDEG